MLKYFKEQENFLNDNICERFDVKGKFTNK